MIYLLVKANNKASSDWQELDKRLHLFMGEVQNIMAVFFNVCAFF